MARFLSTRSQKTLFWTFFLKNRRTKFPIFYENRGLTPLKNAKFSTFVNSCFVVLNG